MTFEVQMGEMPVSDHSDGKGMLDTSTVVREAIVSKFAKAFSVQSSEKSNQKISVGIVNADRSQKECSSDVLTECISRTLDGNTVFCTIPSLDLNSNDGSSNEDDTAVVNPLPAVGDSYVPTPMDVGNKDTKPHEEKKIPEMAASVLQPTLTKPVDTNIAFKKLESMTSWTRSSVHYAGSAIAKNIGTSFSTLLGSRVRAWTLLLLKQSLTQSDASSRGRLLSMLSSNIEISQTETLFKTLPLPESARGLPNEQGMDVTLPLIFQAVIHVKTGHNQIDEIKIRAPGAIAANFDKNLSKPGLCKVEIRLDCKALLDNLVEQARLVVFKTVAQATSAAGAKDPKAVAAVAAANPMNIISHGSDRGTDLKGSASSTVLSTKITGLNLSSDTDLAAEPSRLKKAKSSALRLNKILEDNQYDGKTDAKNVMLNDEASPFAKTRKNRSVHWNQPAEEPTREPVGAKRRRVVQSAARLRSTKSFGKPYAGTSGGPRNATFNEFGGKAAQSGPMWGQDGKLRYHPTAMQTAEEQQDAILPAGGGSNRQNAMFDLHRPRITSLHGLTRNKKPEINPALDVGIQAGMTRTATALENWLLNETKRV